MQTKEPTPKERFLNSLSNFIQTNKVILIILVSAIAAFLIAFAVISEVNKSIIEKSTTLAEQVQQDYSDWISETEESKKNELESSILEQIDEILEKYSRRYAGQRVLFVRGNVFFEKEEWEQSANDFLTVAGDFPESYLAPISMVNAATAYEEAGMIDKAIEVYNNYIDKYEEFTYDIPRALFTLGRLYELKDDVESAKDTYNKLIDNFPSSGWTNLVRNRIIYLNIKE